MKKILKIIGIILLLILLVAIPMFITLIRNPGLYLKLVSDKLVEDQTVEASFNYDFDDTSKIKKVPYFYFVPSESGNYTFSAVDLKSSSDVYVTINVMDKYLNDYFVADNRDHDTEGVKDSIEETTALQESQLCLVIINVEPVDGDLAQFSGSFRLTVTKSQEDEDLPLLTMDEPVTMNVASEGQACAVFIPPETGYYRFDHSIVSHDSSKGYSSLSSITSADKLKVGLTNDICMLLKDKEYYIWMITNETSSKQSKVELSCTPMNTVKAKGICSVELTGDSVIEYVADKECSLAFYSVSSGDPKLVIYEQAGFPLRSDDTSEASLSDNPDDVATVLRVKEGTGLHICVFGDVADCRMFITEYTGDGTSLTTDDLVPVPEGKVTDKTNVDEPEEGIDEETEGEE